MALTTSDDDGSGRAPANYGSESDGAKDMYVTGVSARAGEVAWRGSVKTFSSDLICCLKSSAAVAAAKRQDAGFRDACAASVNAEACSGLLLFARPCARQRGRSPRMALDKVGTS